MVKFSHAIALNANPNWREFYISYSGLKKTTYVLEKAVLGTGTIPKNHFDLQELVSPQSPVPTTASTAADQISSRRVTITVGLYLGANIIS